jgi:hypothetical protein
MKTIKITPNLARIQFDSMEEWLVRASAVPMPLLSSD